MFPVNNKALTTVMMITLKRVVLGLNMNPRQSRSQFVSILKVNLKTLKAPHYLLSLRLDLKQDGVQLTRMQVSEICRKNLKI